MHIKQKLITVTLAMLVIGATLSSRAAFLPGPQIGPVPLLSMERGKGPKRIVSMAPGITETLFAMGAGKLVCGVTDYCDYPEEVKKLPKVGGYYDPNFEAIIRLHPDLVILLPEQGEWRARFQYLHIETLTVEMNSLAGIYTTFYQLGTICQCEAGAFWWMGKMQEQIWQKPRTGVRVPAPTVMLVINRDVDQPEIREVYIAGQSEFYDELIRIAGGTNVYTQKLPRYPKLSQEGMIGLRPDVLVELVAEPGKTSRTSEELEQDWRTIPGWSGKVPKKVVVLLGNQWVRPGPRILDLIQPLTEAVQGKKTP